MYLRTCIYGDFSYSCVFQSVQASGVALEVELSSLGFFSSHLISEVRTLRVEWFSQDLSTQFLVLEQLFGSCDFESCFETSPIVNCLFCFQIVPLALQITCRLQLEWKCHAILLECFICNYMYSQGIWFKHGFLAWMQRKGLYFARLEVALKKQHTLILKCFYCSLKKA